MIVCVVDDLIFSIKISTAAKQLGVDYEFLFMQASGDQLGRIAALVDAGIIRPVVGATFPFEETPEALGSLGSSRFRGKAVVTHA